MSNFTTELIAALSSGQDVTEFFRNEIETAINSILEHELTSFLDYEKWDPIGYNSGNSRNGFYGRSLKTKYGMLNLRIPRDRSGEFTQQTVTPYRQTRSCNKPLFNSIVKESLPEKFYLGGCMVITIRR